MTEKQAKKIFDKYNPATGVVRCPNGRAKMRKPLDLYAQAAVNLYGIIKRNEFVSIFNAQNEEQTTQEEVYIMLLPLVLKNGWYGFYKDYIVHYAVLENFDWVEAIESHQADKPRYIPSKDELLKYEWEDYEDNEHWSNVRSFMWDAFGLSKNTSEAFAELKMYFTHSTGVSKLGPIMESHNLVFENDTQVQDFMNLIMTAKNNKRIWENKGHTPNELVNMRKSQPSNQPQEIAVHQPKKVGRNDPCPCGSGKKYKRCCALIETSQAAQLAYSERREFYETWYKLLDYVNRKLKVVDYKFSLKYSDWHDETLLHKIREVLWDKPELISEFVSDKANSYKLSEAEITLMQSWQKHHVRGRFVLMKYIPEYAIFMFAEESKDSKLYAVKGMTTSIAEAMSRKLPVMLETVLLPFGDKIIYDSFMASHPVDFGDGAIGMFESEYAESENKYGIITKFTL